MKLQRLQALGWEIHYSKPTFRVNKFCSTLNDKVVLLVWQLCLTCMATLSYLYGNFAARLAGWQG